MNELHITPAEWSVMRVIWANEPVGSNEVIKILQLTKDWQPTTIKTLINRLLKKAYLVREKKNGKFVYSAALSEDNAIMLSLQNIFQQFCQHKAGTILAELITDIPLTQADIHMLQRILTEKIKAAPEKLSCNCPEGQCTCR